MKSATAELYYIKKQLTEELAHLKEVRDTYYKDGKGGQLHNILSKLQLRGYRLENTDLITVSKYDTLDSIEKEIKDLSNTVSNLKQLEDDLI